MSDDLYELLSPYFDAQQGKIPVQDQATSDYLNRLTTLSLDALTTTELESLQYDTQSIGRSLQALAKRSYKSINASVNSLGQLQTVIPQISSSAGSIQRSLPTLESEASRFAEKYAHPLENPVLDRRKQAMRLSENVDRLSDILELPTLLSSTISASTLPSAVSGAGAISSANANYASALDLYAHIKRLQRLYPDSSLIRSIVVQAEEAMRGMTTNLINALRSSSLKLAGGMRLIGLLRRVAPELDEATDTHKLQASAQNEGSLGALFLVCRLINLTATLEALDPLRELADQETEAAAQGSKERANTWVAGQQTERYLKRYVEIFREQCFAIVSMYKNIFPASLQGPVASGSTAPDTPSLDGLGSMPRSSSFQKKIEQSAALPEDPVQTLPPALATFTMHLVETLVETLKTYMPNVHDRSSRDSLLTQVLYCAGSLGRLGGDFSMMLALLEEELETNAAQDDEWIDVIRKHRVQAGRLELLASGVGRDKASSSREITSQG